jgi:hypothetical protein
MQKHSQCSGTSIYIWPFSCPQLGRMPGMPKLEMSPALSVTSQRNAGAIERIPTELGSASCIILRLAQTFLHNAIGDTEPPCETMVDQSANTEVEKKKRAKLTFL